MTTASAALTLLLLAPQPPVFRTGVELVYVDVSVTKRDAPVTGLEARDFEVEDNGVGQRVEVVDRELMPTTAVLALDASASVAGPRLAHLQAAARVFLAGLRERDEAALVTFSERLVLRRDATRDLPSVAAALDRVRPRGGTAVVDALYACLKKRWGTGRSLVVLFTDGQDSASWLDNEDVLQAARESSALLHVVGTDPSQAGDPKAGESGHVCLLRRAAQTTGGAYWPVESTDDLTGVFRRIVEAAAARYVIRYEPTGVARAGRHRLKVSVRRRGVDVRARQEYVVSSASDDN